MKKSNKDKIVTHAMELFWFHGASRIGINQIIEESGVAKASFYYYFKTKDDLVKECVTLFNRVQVMKFEEIARRSDSFRGFISELVDDVTGSFDVGAGMRGCPIATIGFSIDMGNDEFSELYRRVFGEWKEMIMGLIYKLQSVGGLSRDIDVERAALRIIQVLEGAMTMWRLTGDISFVRDLKELLPAIVQ